MFHMNWSLHLNKRKQYIDVSSNQFLFVCVFFSKYSRKFWYITSWILDQNLEEDMSGDAEIDCIKVENYLTRSVSCIVTISNRVLRAILDLCMNFFEMCILQQTSEWSLLHWDKIYLIEHHWYGDVVSKWDQTKEDVFKKLCAPVWSWKKTWSRKYFAHD